MSNKKRKLEMSEDQIKETEQLLFSKVEAAHGAKAAKIKEASELASRAVNDLKRARQLVGEVDDGQVNNIWFGTFVREFEEKYPPVDLPQAVKTRNPGVFTVSFGDYRSFTDLRSEKRKEEDKKHAERDAEIIARYERRKEAMATIMRRSNTLIDDCITGARTVAQIRVETELIPTAVTQMTRLYMK